MKNLLNSIFGYHTEPKYEFALQETGKNASASSSDEQENDIEHQAIYTSLAVNLEYLKVIV